MLIKRKSLDLFVVLGLVFIWFLLVLFGVKIYEVWQQILDIGSDASAFVTLFITGHPHFIRYSLMLPTIKTAEYFNVSLDMLFGVQIILLNLGSFIFLNKILNNIWNVSRYNILLFSLFFILSLFMNGRITFAFFGMSLIIYTFYFYLIKVYSNLAFFFLCGVGLICMAVSTGTFMVGLISIILFSFINYYRNIKIKFQNILSSQIFLLLVACASIFPLFMKYLNKNLEFFDGSFINMLSHGVGRIFYSQSVILLIIVLLPILFFVLVKLFQKALFDSQYLITLPVLLGAIFVGMFGYSSLFVGLPAVFILLCLTIGNIKRKI